MDKTSFGFYPPKEEKELSQFQALIRMGKIAEAQEFYHTWQGGDPESAQRSVEKEREFLAAIDRSVEIDLNLSKKETTARAAVILAAAVGWKGDEPSSWTRPIDRETLLAWAQSHYVGQRENLEIALDALAMQGLFFDIHPSVFQQTTYYCSFDIEFLDEIQEDAVPIGAWKHSFEKGINGRQLAIRLWKGFTEDYDSEYGLTWRTTGLCWGQGSQSGGSRWGPCVGTSCCCFRDGEESCTQELKFNPELKRPSAPE